MKGSHRVIVETERMKYEFTICRNITVVLGDSATGKTTLIELLHMYSQRGPGSGVSVQSDISCVVFNAIAGHWRSALEGISQSIIFIDEGQPFIFSKDFADAIQNSDNYYVLITRRPLHNLPYSTKEIYGIRTTGKYHFPEKIYQEFYPIYENTSTPVNSGKHLIILEDSNSGYEFFKKAFPDIECISAGGNTKITGKLLKMSQTNSSMVIADGAAFGAYIENLLSIRDLKGNISLYLPESFEWLILRSGIINRTEISRILDHPEDYIDSSLYFSWERFFTELLEKETSDNNIIRYTKSKLNNYYISEQNIRKVLNTLPETVRSYIMNTDSKI